MLDANQIFAQRSAFSRLFPSTLFTAVFLYACYIFASNYEPPPTSARLFASVPPAVATFLLLFNLNALVFILWKQPAAWKFLNRYFMLSAGHPRVFSLLGNIFSHQYLKHLLSNMAILYFVGNGVHDLVGRGNFLAVYLGTGVVSSLGALWIHVLQRNYWAATIGASGALYGLIGCYCALQDKIQIAMPFYPERKFELNTTVPFVTTLLSAVAPMFLKNPSVDYRTHITGLLAGYVAGRLLRAQATGKEEADDAEVAVAEPAVKEETQNQVES